MRSDPLVSVVIPTFNSSKFILQAIHSVEEQTYQNYEIIIVDDGSTDNTVEIVSERILANPRIKLFKINHTGIPSVPRNYGIKKSSGEFVAFLDSDDLWHSSKLKEQLIAFKENPGLLFVYSTSITFGDYNFISPYFELLPLYWKAARNHDELLKKGNSIPLSSVLVRRDILLKLNGFDEDPELQIEDYDLWLRISKLGSFKYIPKIHVYYRIHPSQYSADWEIKEKRLKYLSKKRNISLPEYRFIRNKNIFVRFIRNIIHLLNYLLLRITDFISRGFSER
jgi:glycosyltransferase involved in cell wall biosynthesis